MVELSNESYKNDIFLIFNAIFNKVSIQDDSIVKLKLLILQCAVLNLLNTISIVFIAFLFKKVDLVPLNVFFGFCKRFTSTFTVQIVYSVVVSSFFNKNMNRILFVSQTSLIFMPPFLFLYCLEILKPRLVFGLFLLLTVKKIIVQIGPIDKSELFLKILTIGQQLLIFKEYRSSSFIDLW